MTVREFIKSLDRYPDMEGKDGRTLKDRMQDVTRVWSNASCSGYALRAMRAAGFSETDIWRVLRCLEDEYTIMTVEDAEQAFNEWKRI